MRRHVLASTAAVAALAAFGGCICGPWWDDGSKLVDDSLRHYSDLVLHMDTDGIAGMFAVDGELVNPGQPAVLGRDAIRSLFEGFKGYQVLENEDKASSTDVQAITAVQLGTYRQKVRAPDGTILKVSGRFKFEWVRAHDGRWLIQRISTFPDH